jgi:arabinan endo-1,5-alpha-L-arabinosidase
LLLSLARPLFVFGTLLLAVLVGGASAGTVAAQQATPGTPVHDPVMIEEDGTYYLFGTGTGISVWSSPDREDGTREAPVFDEPPPWDSDVVSGAGHPRGEVLADIAEHDGTYYLYYSISDFGENTSAIGVATTPTLDPEAPNHEWTDHGIVVESVPGRDLWNAIDPNLIVADDGTPWLTFGSFWEGIKLVEMADPPTATAADAEWHTLAARHRYWKLDERDAGDRMNGAIEAPFLFKHGDYYYLFASWDRCCRGEESTYKVVVGRSKDITGPYLDKEDQDMRLGGGSLVVDGNQRWPGVGHSATVTFDGTDYLVFHGYDAQDDGDSKLWIREIEWFHGWPQVSLD